MKCKDCLIWRNRKEDLARQAIDLVDYSCAKGFEEIAKGVAISTDRAFRKHIGLLDTECPEGRCILTNEE